MHVADDSRIGSKLTTLRESLGLSTDELAERCDCDVATIERLEGEEFIHVLAGSIDLEARTSPSPTSRSSHGRGSPGTRR